MESLLSCKRDVYADLIAVVAKGTSESRISAVNLLFHYWPLMNPHIIHPWSPQQCQNLNCSGEKAPSVKKSFDPAACAKVGDTVPPMSLCKSCADDLETSEPLYFICQPMPASNSTGCESSNRIAYGTCFSEDCIRSHQHVPLRLCQECMQALHSNVAADEHIKHMNMTCLLKETSGQLEGTEGETKRPKWLRQLEAGQSLGRDIDAMSDERRMLGRFGIWLMAALCPPSPEAPPAGVGYIMSMLFQWFANDRSFLPNDSMGAQLEQLKTDFASDWVNLALANHYEVFVAILNPNVPEYAQVGGIWDKLCSKKEQFKEGLSKLLSLMPYDVISLETWNRVIAQWLSVISDSSSEDDYSELKILLCKIFEPDLCPLPFDQRKVFDFIYSRMSNGSYSEVLDALDWLHLLCRMDIRITMEMLMEMLTIVLNRANELVKPHDEENDLEEDIGPLAIQVIMVDIIAQQMKLNEINTPEMTTHASKLFLVMSLILQYPDGETKLDAHSCQNPETDQFSDCIRCQQAAFLYQIIMQLTEQLCPPDEIKIEVGDYNHSDWLAEAQLSDSITTPSHISNLTSPRNPSILATSATSPLFSIDPQGQVPQKEEKRLSSMQYLSSVHASQQEEAHADEFVGILPSEEIETATAQQVTLTDSDLGPRDLPDLRPNIRSGVWDTSVGRFHFNIDQLPPQLQFVYALLTNIDREIDPDVQYFLLYILKYLCLHCEALSNARHENRGFLIWAQENLLIPKLWGLLKSHYAQVGQLAVPLIIHAITLPCGEEIFWNTVNRDFTSEAWETRFKAVERVYVLAHLIIPQPIICFCLESQFDSCILDRPLIISRIILLTTIVPEENIFSWDFFIQRFETLAIEAQLKCQQGEHGFVQDLLHTDPMSELYQRKVTKARQSLNEASSVRSIVKSLRENSLKHQLTTNAKIERVDGLVPEATNMGSSITHQGSGQYGRLREFTDEESNLCLLLNRVVDMENPERHTIYLTVALFVHFLCNKKSNSADEKATAKKQSVLLRHFNTLLGYSSSEKCFTIPPHRIRRAAVCNAFMSGLPEILDNNLMIGNQMLPIILQLLLHLPSPQKFASDQSSADYSLSLLNLSLRHSWLHTLLLILYKYRFDTPPISDLVAKLVMIVIATIECHVHVNACSASETTPVDDSEERVIREEDDDATMTPTAGGSVSTIVETNAEPEKPSILRPESLKVTRASSGSHLISFATFLQRADRNVRRGETISMCLIVLSTFLHRESAMAAPVLFRIFKTVANYINYPVFPWNEANVFVPGNSQSVAKQLFRVIIHQLSSSGIALQLFDSKIDNPLVFWQTVCTSLLDFNELNPVALIQCLLDDLMENWTLKLARIFHNLSAYIQHVPLDSYVSNWSTVVGQFEAFYRKYYSQLATENTNTANGARTPITTEFKSLIVVMSSVMRVQGFSSFKGSVTMVESYSKWLTEALHECKTELRDLLSICSICNRSLHRERDKQCLTRAIVTELVHAIKFRCELVEPNYMTIVELILQDFGEEVSEDITDVDQFNTGASEAVRPFLSEILEFIADLHVLSKLKKQTNSDRMGGDLKAGLAEVLALEMSRPAVRDNRTVGRFIPWLLSPPNVTQAVPGAFAESVTNVRILSWLLLGALHASQDCFPVPINCSNHMADYIHFVLAGFADQSKQSVVHMSALFHAFHLCQLWTVYCEKAASLLAHSKVLADMVNLHFVNTMQALQQCNSATLCQLYPMCGVWCATSCQVRNCALAARPRFDPLDAKLFAALDHVH
ncbi:Uncoordinated protein 79 [Aphelenchoides fujianensis]|nr:Uncoordinated protein 79 [Aphelenchoides fujianensis]